MRESHHNCVRAVIPYRDRACKRVTVRMAKQSLKQSAVSFLRAAQIPEDFLKGNVLVSMEGQERITIENFKGISSYTPMEIRLITDQRKISIAGDRLKIDRFSREEIEISGRIRKLEYL